MKLRVKFVPLPLNTYVFQSQSQKNFSSMINPHPIPPPATKWLYWIRLKPQAKSQEKPKATLPHGCRYPLGIPSTALPNAYQQGDGSKLEKKVEQAQLQLSLLDASTADGNFACIATMLDHRWPFALHKQVQNIDDVEGGCNKTTTSWSQALWTL